MAISSQAVVPADGNSSWYSGRKVMPESMSFPPIRSTMTSGGPSNASKKESWSNFDRIFKIVFASNICKVLGIVRVLQNLPCPVVEKMLLGELPDVVFGKIIDVVNTKVAFK